MLLIGFQKWSITMETSVSILINKPKEDVWEAITDFENCQNYIEAIESLEILHNPEDTLLGFKWKETRVMFGKESTETMWITAFAENEFYQARAESHGSIYTSRLSIQEEGEQTRLTMSFAGEAISFFAKVMSKLMSSMIMKSMDKALLKDLEDIKTHVESK
jgi:carbon monoxide dehydrogenase subunit G